MTSSRQSRSFLYVFCVFLSTFRLNVGNEETTPDQLNIQLTQDQPINPIEGSYVILNTKMVKIVSGLSSSPCLDCTISIIPSTSNNTAGEGHFANKTDNLDRPISTFTYDNIVKGDIAFVFNILGGTLQYTQPIEISLDDETISSVLNVSVMPLTLSISFDPPGTTDCLQTLDLLNDTRIQLSKDTLSVSLEQQSERLPEITVNVVRPPLLGSLKHIESNESLSNSFSYTLFLEEQIVYETINRESQNDSDSFDVQLSIGHALSPVVTITICLKPLPYPMLVNLSFISVYVRGEVAFTSNFLKSTVTRSQGPEDLIYDLIATPTFGVIVKDHTLMSVSSLHYFSQKEVNEGKIIYVNKRQSTNKNMMDMFRFRVRNEYYTSKIYTAYIHLKENQLTVINTGFSVTENSEHIIKKSELFAEAPDSYALQSVYILDPKPSHGVCILKRPSPQPVQMNPGFFSLEDIEMGYLSYNHTEQSDEAREDMFAVLFIATKNNSDSLFMSVMVNVTILQVNDNRPVRVIEKDISVIEGTEVSITTKDLLYTDHDNDYDDDDLIYRVNIGPFHGKLCVRNVCKGSDFVHSPSPSLTWTQRDMRNGDLVYKSDHLLAAKSIDRKDFISFAVSDYEDGLTSETDFISVVLESVIPTGYFTQEIQVREGSSSPITLLNIFFTADTVTILPSEYQFTITKPPRHGNVHWESTNDAVKLFNQQHVIDEKVEYRHDGSNSLRDSFDFTLNVRSFTRTYTLHVAVEPVNDDIPVLAVQENIFVEFTSSVHLNKTQLMIQDDDTDEPNALEYIIKENVRFGVLEKRPSTFNETYSMADRFTQQDINDENVRYRHTYPHKGPGNFVDYFTFDLYDGKNPSGPFNSSIFILPESVPITVIGTQVQEGSTVLLTPETIQIQHPYFAGTRGKVFLTPEGLKYGFLTINGEKCQSQVCDFYTDDLEKERIEYTHSGGEQKSDYFIFFIDWSGLLQTAYKNYTIKILPVNNQEPYIQKSSGLTIWATETIPLTQSHLFVNDPDSDSNPENLVYHFSNTHQNGYFKVNGERKQSFTQADINNGLVAFVDTHSYEGFTSHLKFTVTDGIFSVGGQFNVTARVVALTEVVNERLSVGMGDFVSISGDKLSFVPNNPDINDTMISYRIIEDFKYGTVLDATGGKISTFTQEDVNMGLLTYHHTGVDIWESHDFARIIVDAPLVLEKKNFTLGIDIAVLNESNPLAVNRPLKVIEGRQVCFDQNSLDGRNVRYYAWKSNPGNVTLQETQLTYVITKPPNYGELLINGTITTYQSEFTHSDLLDGELCYSNNGFEVDYDEVSIDVLVTSPYKELDRVSDVLRVKVKLVNDEKPQLITSNHHKTLVNGFWFPITSQDLSVVDEDNTADEIVYSVVQHEHVSLRLGNMLEDVVEFTQANIDNGNLMALSNVSGDISIVLGYSDGNHSEGRLTFKLTVVDHKLELLVEDPTLMFSQTKQVAVINTHVINTSTNGHRNSTQYSIIKAPTHGEIRVNGKAANAFTQIDVDNGVVFYHLKSHESSRDSLEVEASNKNAKIRKIIINVIVYAGGIIGEGHYILPPAMLVKVPSSIIQLNDLSAHRHISIEINPTMQYGSFERRVTKSAVTGNITKFEYGDLTNGYVYFRWDTSPNIVAGQKYNESVTGIVRIQGLAPGEFSLTLTLQAPQAAVLADPSKTTTIETPQSTTTDKPNSSENSRSESSFNLSLYAPLFALIIILALAMLFMVGFCCSQSKHIKQRLYRKSTAVNFHRASPIQKPVSHSQSPVHLHHSPPLTGGFDQEFSDSETSSNPDVLMVHHTQQPMTTISASHTYLPRSPCSFDPTSSGYHTHTSAVTGTSPTFMRRQESPLIPSTTMLTRNELRSSSPIRRAGGNRRNTRPYASMTVSSGRGKTSPTRSRDYGSPLHALQLRPQVADSTSSLGYDTSSMTQESIRLPSVSSPLPVNLESILDEENVTDLYRKTHPVLKQPQYWV